MAIRYPQLLRSLNLIDTSAALETFFAKLKYRFLFWLEADPGESSLIIQNGANILIGKSANPIIKGAIEIESGANIEINGRIEIVEAADDKPIAVAKAKLQRLEK